MILTVSDNKHDDEVDDHKAEPGSLWFVGPHSIVHHGVPILASQHLNNKVKTNQVIYRSGLSEKINPRFVLTHLNQENLYHWFMEILDWSSKFTGRLNAEINLIAINLHWQAIYIHWMGALAFLSKTLYQYPFLIIKSRLTASEPSQCASNLTFNLWIIFLSSYQQPCLRR